VSRRQVSDHAEFRGSVHNRERLYAKFGPTRRSPTPSHSRVELRDAPFREQPRFPRRGNFPQRSFLSQRDHSRELDKRSRSPPLSSSMRRTPEGARPMGRRPMLPHRAMNPAFRDQMPPMRGDPRFPPRRMPLKEGNPRFFP